MDNFWTFLTTPYQTYSITQIVLEIIAATLGVASTYFSMKRHIWVYPTGIVSTAIYIYLLFVFGLYGDMLINAYYTSMSVYGWILWHKAIEQDEVHVPVLHITKKEITIGIGLFLSSVLLVLGIYYYRPVIAHHFDMRYLTHSGFHYTLIDYFDAVLTATFLLGMWLMARRKLENWVFWILGDIVAIGLFLVKGLAITALQYGVFLVLAVMGYFAWKKQLGAQSH